MINTGRRQFSIFFHFLFKTPIKMEKFLVRRPEPIPDLLSTLKTTFGLDSFRGQQKDIIDSLMAGRDTLVLMQTGGGKSLTYQLPACCSPGVTVVVSPLLALIENQVQALIKLGIKAATMDSTVAKSVKDQV